MLLRTKRDNASVRHTSATEDTKAVVLLSGGMDSTTVLAHALAQGFSVYALSCDYGQRHRAELRAARDIAIRMQAVRHRTISLDLAAITRSALTNTTQVIPQAGTSCGIPPTYVPGRNIIFLALAVAWADTLDAPYVMIGANQVDYSGYPDCREDFLKAFQAMVNCGTRRGISTTDMDGINIQAPLLNMTKAEIIKYGVSLGVDYAHTVSCYRADDAGRACSSCDACNLRKQGFIAANMTDPTRYTS